MEPESTDRLAGAHGCLNALIIMIPIYVLIVGAIVFILELMK